MLIINQQSSGLTCTKVKRAHHRGQRLGVLMMNNRWIPLFGLVFLRFLGLKGVSPEAAVESFMFQ